MSKKKVKRLASAFWPKDYDLQLRLDPGKMRFFGVVKITGKKTGPPSKRLTLHQKGLKISKAQLVKLQKSGEQDIRVNRINAHESLSEVRLHSDDVLFGSQYTLSIEFSGKITDAMHGLYPCRFFHMGKEKLIFATQFESHHAREVFPCIDEPEAKATFSLTLIAPEKQKVLSNTPIKKQASLPRDKGFIETQFETTPVMPTYLLAFAVGEMHCVSGKTKSNVAVSSWASVAQPKSYLKYANKEAVDILNFYEKYFKTPYPLAKCDQLALPDFESGAMENWGLITYREVALLSDPINRSFSSERYISLVVAHELSHQWFGNLVTMRWWDDLWLNESFASLIEHIALDNLHPDWQQWEFFASTDVVVTANRDIYSDVQPVGVDVRHPDEIQTLFDHAIVYAKGARLLKMLYDFVGEEAFRSGLAQYFKKHAYGNTTRDDLWHALSASSKQNVAKLMTPWLQKPGQPMLSVKRDKDKVGLAQERFLLDGDDKASLWPIPLLSDRKLPVHLLDKRSAEFEYPAKSDLTLNPLGSGHFIVNYRDKTALEAIKTRLINRKIDSAGRIVFLNDLLLLAQKGEHSLADVLDLVGQCDQEPRDSVWSLFSQAIERSRSLIEGNKTTEGQVKNFKSAVASYWYAKLGWDDRPRDDNNTKLLRCTALALSIGGEDKGAIDTALTRFAKAALVEKLPAEQRAIIAGSAVRFGDKSVPAKLMREYENNPNPDVQHAITAALCSTREAAVAEKIISWALEPKPAVRDQDIFRWYAYLITNQYTREVAWRWLVRSWAGLEKKFAGSKSFDYFIRYSALPITTAKWQKRFGDFFQPKAENIALKRDIAIARAEIANRVAWRQRDEAKIKAYLQNYTF